MQTLLGLSAAGELRHAEVFEARAPSQLLGLAETRWGFFERIEVWDDTVCVLRLPPVQAPNGQDR